jgi:hypothetical protein
MLVVAQSPNILVSGQPEEFRRLLADGPDNNIEVN